VDSIVLISPSKGQLLVGKTTAHRITNAGVLALGLKAGLTIQAGELTNGHISKP
jgi:hypothetical protein